MALVSILIVFLVTRFHAEGEHRYAAQLIHYGLPVTKEKSRAKVRLLDALNQGKLEVPSWISKMEGEMRGEWEGENKKLKKGGGVVKAKSGKTNEAVKGKVGKSSEAVKGKAGRSGEAVKGKVGKSGEVVKGKVGKGGKDGGAGGSSMQVPGGGINVNGTSVSLVREYLFRYDSNGSSQSVDELGLVGAGPA